MNVYDFDKTIEQVQNTHSAIQRARDVELEIARHPEYYDSLCFNIMPAIAATSEDFSETTETIFSSNIETFNTLGNVNFVHEVSSFYSKRRSYQQHVLDELKKEVYGSEYAQHMEGFLGISFPMHYYTSWECLKSFQETRNRCMQMMKVSEDELKEFSRLRSVVEDEVSEEDERIHEQAVQEFIEAEKALIEAREKFAQDK